MTKSISCKDAGSPYGWSATAKTEEELIAMTTQHVKEHHKDLQLNPDLVKKIKSLIKTI